MNFSLAATLCFRSADGSGIGIKGVIKQKEACVQNIPNVCKINAACPFYHLAFTYVHGCSYVIASCASL